MIRSKYYVKPTIFGIVMAVLVGCYFYYLKPTQTQLCDLVSSVNSVAMTFSTTFIAFSVAALALLQLIQQADWYKQIEGTKPFNSLLGRLFISIQVCLLILVTSLLGLFIPGIENYLIQEIFVGSLSSIMIFVFVWIWEFLFEYLRLFKA